MSELGRPTTDATQPFETVPRAALPPRPSCLSLHLLLAGRTARFRGTPSPPSPPSFKQQVADGPRSHQAYRPQSTSNARPARRYTGDTAQTPRTGVIKGPIIPTGEVLGLGE